MKQLIRSTILFSQVGLSAWPRRSALGRSLNFCPAEAPPRKILDRLAIFGETGAMKQLIRLTILFCACAALALTAVAGPEPLPSGKEMKQVAPAPPECDYTWTGFYLGGNAGYGWGNGDTHFHPLPDAATFFDLAPQSLSPDPEGFIGGGQIGFNWQWNKWLVLGAETDFQGSDMEGHDTRFNFPNIDGVGNGPDTFLAAHQRMQWFGTARGRIGFAPMCRLLIYATGGLAYGNVDYSANTNFDNGTTYPVSFTRTSLGWTVGGGLEYAISHHWSVKAEYLYYDLGDEGKTQNQLFLGVPEGPPFFVHYNFENTGNIVRGGLNFKF
jgi:outer membrane immunogenic protein